MAVDLHYMNNAEANTCTVGYVGPKMSGTLVVTFMGDETYIMQARCWHTGEPLKDRLSEFSGKLSYAHNNQVCTDLSELLDAKNIVRSVEDIFFHMDMGRIVLENDG